MPAELKTDALTALVAAFNRAHPDFERDVPVVWAFADEMQPVPSEFAESAGAMNAGEVDYDDDNRPVCIRLSLEVPMLILPHVLAYQLASVALGRVAEEGAIEAHAEELMAACAEVFRPDRPARAEGVPA